MPDHGDAPTIKVLNGIRAIDAGQWDACAGTRNPFVRHAFLAALEDSRSAAPESGWGARHLVVVEADGTPAAAMPLYLKGHSYGEYVFDWSWADAWTRAGGVYYPKLQAAVPFTPATGPRLLVRGGRDVERHRRLLLGALVELAISLGVSSAHVTFPTRAEWAACGEAGFMLRRGLQYHWDNPGYPDFDAFLGALTARKRKMIRKERLRANAQGVTFRLLSGEDIKPAHWEAFHRFYLDTVDRKWAHAYLTREFFLRLGETMAERALLVLGEKDGEPVLGALNLMGRDALYGRYWGARADVRALPFLHFEACYYRAMEAAIERGFSRVEAGAQGEHKVLRGYHPVFTYSAHWIADPGFAEAVRDFLRREDMLIAHQARALEDLSPYRRRENTGEPA